MRSLRLLAAVAIGLASLSTAVTRAQAAAAPASIAILSGTWNCSTHGSNGTSTGTVTFEQVNPDLVQFHWMDKTGKNAGNKGAGEWYYDSKKSEYISLGAGPGFWGVSRGSGAADATTLTLTDTYPSDPTNGTTTYHLTASKISFSADYKKDGKPMHVEQTCMKA